MFVDYRGSLGILLWQWKPFAFFTLASTASVAVHALAPGARSAACSRIPSRCSGALPLSALSKTIEINLRERLGDAPLPPMPRPTPPGVLM